MPGRVLRRLLAAALTTGLLAASVVLLGAAPAQACRCAPQGLGAQVEAADVVATGVVVGVRRTDPADRQRQQGGQREGQQGDRQGGRQEAQRRPLPQSGTVTLRVAVDRVFAGQVPDPTIDVTTAAATTACGLGRLPAGERYLFFLTADRQALRATSCNGTAPVSEQRLRGVERLLGEGRDLGAPDAGQEPAAAELTVVDDSPPPDLARTTLPGGLLAVAGLVGLLVLARVGRRRDPR